MLIAQLLKVLRMKFITSNELLLRNTSLNKPPFFLVLLVWASLFMSQTLGFGYLGIVPSEIRAIEKSFKLPHTTN